MKIRLFLIFVIILYFTQTYGQLVVKDAIKANRQKEHNNIIKATTKNLSLPLNDSTEELWQDAFWSIELVQYKAPWITSTINNVFDSIDKRSPAFQRSLLELVYSNYPKQYVPQVNKLVTVTKDAKVFALGSEYLLNNDASKKTLNTIEDLISKKFIPDTGNATIKMLSQRVSYISGCISGKNSTAYCIKNILADVLNENAFANSVVVYSFQRKNRNYPGMVIVRDRNGNFIKDETGNIFSVPQLARSIPNLPAYLTNGNTPEGVFRMDGFDTSKSNFIGPTTNIQLTMPFENTIIHFTKDSTITDSIWTEMHYKNILPESWKNYVPAYQAYYASKAGRTEIIAHGTTVNPEYYKNEIYYPLTPTQGCLCTKEIWSEQTGERLISNQQKLVDAVNQAGGPDGYLIVIELDDKHQPVNIEDIKPYLPY